MYSYLYNGIYEAELELERPIPLSTLIAAKIGSRPLWVKQCIFNRRC